MSGGIYTTRDRTRLLTQLNDVNLDTPTDGQGLVYSNGVWTNGTVAGVGSGGDLAFETDVFTVSGNSDPRNNGSYALIARGVCGSYKMVSSASSGSTQEPTYIAEGDLGVNELGRNASHFGIYEKSDGGQYTTWIYTYDENPTQFPDVDVYDFIGWCSIFGTESFLDRFAPGDFLGSVVETDNVHHVSMLTWNYSDTTPPLSPKATIYTGGELVYIVRTDGMVLAWDATGQKWEASNALATETTKRKSADTTLQTQITNNTNGLAAEVQTRSDADATLTNSLATETSAREAEDTRIAGLTANNTALITSESATRSAEDIRLDGLISTNTSGLAQEVTDRTNADTALQVQINNNAGDISNWGGHFTAADSALQSNIDAVTTNLGTETQARTDEDNRLEGLINTNTSGLASEVTNRTNADTALQTQITSGLASEVADRTNADTALQTQITSGLASEVTDRTNADTALQTQIDYQAQYSLEAFNINAGKIVDEVADRTRHDTALQTQITSNDIELSNLTNQVNNNAAAIAAIETYTPPPSSRFTMQLKDGVPAEGWVTFRNRLYDYSKLKSFQFTANTPFPWGASGPTNGIEQSLNQSLFNGCAEIRHAPQYYWAYEASGANGAQRTFWLMQGQFDKNQFDYGWSFDQGSGLFDSFADSWTLTDTSSGGALVNSLHRSGQFTCHTLSNTGRSTLSDSSDGVAFQEFPLAFSLTNHPYMMTDHNTIPIYQDNTWVDNWGLYATYSTDGLYLYTSRDGMMWDRVATGLDFLGRTVTSISVYPFGRGLGLSVQTWDSYMLAVQPDHRLPAQGYFRNGRAESFCSSGDVVMWWDVGGSNLAFSLDGLTYHRTTVTQRVGGPWVRTNPDPRCDTPSTSAFYYSSPNNMRTSTGLIGNIGPSHRPSFQTLATSPFNSRQIIISLPGQGTNETFIGGRHDSVTGSMVRCLADGSINGVSTANGGIPTGDSILGEIGTTLETRTYAPMWGCRYRATGGSGDHVVTFDRGVTWQPITVSLELPYAFAHSDEVFVCVGYFNDSKGVIFYSTDAVNWYEAVKDPRIPIPPSGVPGISEHHASPYRFSDVYYETEHRRFVAFSQDRVGLSGDGIHWSFVDMPDDPNNPGNRPIFQALRNGWNEYLRYGDAYYTRSGLSDDGNYSRILALRISASGELTFTDTGLTSPRERSRADTIANDEDNGQFMYPQWWATSLGIIAVEWEGTAEFKIYTYSFPRESTTLTKSGSPGSQTLPIITANLGSGQRFFNVTTGFGGLIATGYRNGNESLIYVSPDGINWTTAIAPYHGPLGPDADIVGIEYAGGEQYVITCQPSGTGPVEIRVAKGYLSQSLNINAPVGTITSPENGTNVSLVMDRLLISETPTLRIYGPYTDKNISLFTTEYRSCGVKPLAIVPKAGYANAIGGGQNNFGTDTGNTPGLFIAQPGSSKSVSQRYGLGLGTTETSTIPDGSLVEYELTPNLPKPP